MSKQPKSLTYVKDRVDMRGDSHARRLLEQSWFGNLAYYAGQQLFSERNGAILPIRSASLRKRVRHTANEIRPRVIRAVSKVMGFDPEASVTPQSGDRSDRHAAKVAEKILEHLEQVTSFNKKKRQALIWAAITGSGWIRASWDPDAGLANRIYLDEEGMPDIAPMYDINLRNDAEIAGRFEDVYPGEVDLEVINPFAMRWDQNAKDGGMDAASWVAEVQAIPMETAVNLYGSSVRRAEQEDGDSGSQRYIDSLSVLDQRQTGAIGDVNDELFGERVRRVQFIERPMKSNKWRGRLIILVGNKVVRDDRSPFVEADIELPYAKVDWFPNPGQFTGGSLVSDLRYPQKSYNRSRSMALEIERRHGYPVTWIPKGSDVKKHQLKSHPGMTYEYNAAAGKPIFGVQPQVPPYVAQNAAIARDEMDSISAQSLPESSKLPGQLRSGAAIRMMQADGNQVLTPTVESAMDFVSSIGTMMLSLAHRHYSSERSIVTAGKGSGYDVSYFSSADMRGHYHVRVRSKMGSNESPEAYQARLGDMVEAGILDPQNPMDKLALLKALNFRTTDELVSRKLGAVEKQERELDAMIRGMQAAVHPWDDHAVHAAELEAFMQSLEFERLDDQVKMLIVEHWQGHTQVIQQQMEAQMRLAEASRGTPGVKGEASKPSVRN